MCCLASSSVRNRWGLSCGRAAGIDPETESRADATRYAGRVRRWERARQPDPPPHGPGLRLHRYREAAAGDGGTPRFLVAVCQPTAKAARLVTRRAFIGFRSTQTVGGGWLASLKGRDGLV